MCVTSPTHKPFHSVPSNSRGGAVEKFQNNRRVSIVTAGRYSASSELLMGFDASLSRRSLLLALGAPLVRGQQEPGATFSAGVKVVNLFANVRNKKGEIVKDLGKDDFYLSEDG